MKKIIIFLIVAAIFTTACTRDITVALNNTINTSTTVTGNFTLTKFTNHIDDSTTAFTGYIFSFSNDGKITVVKNNQTVFGTYTQTYSYAGNPDKFGIFFTTKPLSNLNRNWQVNSVSDAAIHLTDTYTGEILEFTAE